MAKKPPRSPNAHDLFLSWSKTRSKHVALAFRTWIKDVIQSARPWMSEVDIPKGSVGTAAITKKLKVCKAGVVFVTPENQGVPWLNYEAGSIANAVGGHEARVFTVLLGGMRFEDVEGPLSQYQHTAATKDGFKTLVTDIAKALGARLDPEQLANAFEAHWPKMEKVLAEMPPEPNPPKHRDRLEMIPEILTIVRSLRPMSHLLEVPYQTKLPMGVVGADSPLAGLLFQRTGVKGRLGPDADIGQIRAYFEPPEEWEDKDEPEQKPEDEDDEKD